MNVKAQFKAAEQLAQEALALSVKVGDKFHEMRAMLYLGSAFYYEGRLPEALEVFQKNATLAREIGNKKGLSRTLNNIAGVLGDLGRDEESLSYFFQCLDVARELHDDAMIYTTLKNIGDLYVRLGDPDKAEAPLLEALQIGRQLKQSDIVANPSTYATQQGLLSLGGMEVAREHYQAALKYYEQVRASNPDNPLFLMDMYGSMAEIDNKLGQHQKSIQLFREAMAVAEKAGATGQYARILSNLGQAEESLGHLDEALAAQERALALIRQGGGNPDDEWQIESRIAHVKRAQAHPAEALQAYEQAIGGIERLRAAAVNTERGRAGILVRSRASYAETTDLLHELHRESEALEMAERGRARAFLDILAQSRVGLTNELSAEQRDREQSILARMSRAERNLWKENISEQERKKAEAELAAAEEDLDAFQIEVRQSNPRFASVQYPEPINLAEIQSKLLDENSALIEYLLGEKRSLAWVVTRQKLAAAVLPSRKEIEDQVTAYRKLLTRRASKLTVHESLIELSRAGAKLYRLIFQPIESALGSSRSLIVVPDGTLGYLPFEALVAGSDTSRRPTYLAEKFAVVYGPSASALAMVHAMNHKPERPAKSLLAFGDPVTAGLASTVDHHAAEYSATALLRDLPIAKTFAERGFSLAPLPHTRYEVTDISKLFPVQQRRVYLGAEARKETVNTEKLEDFRFIHFATHGFLDEAKPGRSGILLSRDPGSSEDGFLRMDEIMRLKLNADLVTLSACSTGLGKLVNGEGVIGLTRAFFYAGARDVAVSLWNVNDSATAKLMHRFYRNLNRDVPEREAMREAKLSLLHGSNPVWQHPYFWAPFVIEGEGR